jgi:hypothetical protein
MQPLTRVVPSRPAARVSVSLHDITGATRSRATSPLRWHYLQIMRFGRRGVDPTDTMGDMVATPAAMDDHTGLMDVEPLMFTVVVEEP